MANMKVTVTVKIDIDPDVWAAEYGFDAADKEGIRKDVKFYVYGAIRDHLGGLGMLASR